MQTMPVVEDALIYMDRLCKLLYDKSYHQINKVCTEFSAVFDVAADGHATPRMDLSRCTKEEMEAMQSVLQPLQPLSFPRSLHAFFGDPLRIVIEIKGAPRTVGIGY